jgi:predicted CoA-binding protein
MSEKTVAQKLLVKPGYKVLLLNPPAGYAELLGELPAGAILQTEPAGPVDLIQVFVFSHKDLETQLARLKPWFTPKSILWVTYHKSTSKVKTDINRDTINVYAHSVGLEGVAMISVDQDWSALRLKVI